MDEAEKDRIRELIKSRQIKPVEVTPERQAEIDAIVAEIAKDIRIVQTGPNDFRLTGVPENERSSTAEPPPFSPEAGLLFRGRLTKGLVQTFPEGSIVQTNTYIDRRTPKAVEKVGSVEARAELWARLRSSGATRVTCNVWRDWESYQRFQKLWYE